MLPHCVLDRGNSEVLAGYGTWYLILLGVVAVVIMLTAQERMLDEAREEIRDNLDHSASLVEALRLDRELLAKVVLRLEHHITTRHVGMKSLQTMRDVIKRRLGDEHLAPPPRPHPQLNGELGGELRA